MKKAYKKIIFGLKHIKRFIAHDDPRMIIMNYYNRFRKNAFVDLNCKTKEQFDASITRLYHTIEKGLSYRDYRAGFGTENVNKLLVTLEQYVEHGYDPDDFTYSTAVSCLYEYIKKNKENKYTNTDLERRVEELSGNKNNCGGTIQICKPCDVDRIPYDEFIKSRHSTRCFSDIPVENEVLYKAIKLAQYTPSACNRQGWKTIVVSSKERMFTILSNQNGNRGFGSEIDKLLVVTADLRTEQKEREVFQAYIDGGMYASTLLYSLHFYGIASIPLSASLTPAQEKIVRETCRIDQGEVIILIIGVGNYVEGTFLTARSERKPATIVVI